MATDIEARKAKLREATASIKKELQVALKEDSAELGKMAMIGGAAFVGLLVTRKVFKSRKKKKRRRELVEAVQSEPLIESAKSTIKSKPVKTRNPFVRTILEQVGLIALGLAKKRIFDYLEARKLADE